MKTAFYIFITLVVWVNANSCGPLDTTPRPFESQASDSNTYDIPNNRVLKQRNYLNCDDGTYLTYENFGEEFFLNHCSSCHSEDLTTLEDRSGAPLEINLNSPEGVEINRVGILSVTRAYLQDLGDEDDEDEDSDGDGIPDREEDSDGDGIPDVNEDENGNGIPDVSENQNDEEDEEPLPEIIMPPSGVLPIATLKNLKEYLECGAPSGVDKIK